MFRVSGPTKSTRVRFGPAGRVEVIDGSKLLQVWDLDGRQPTRRFELPNVSDWQFTAAGDALVVTRPGGALAVHDAVTGEVRSRFMPGRVTSNPAVAVHPTALFAAVGSYSHREVEIRDLRTGATTATLEVSTTGHTGGMWSPDGRLLAFCEGEASQLVLADFDPESGAARLRARIAHGGGKCTNGSFNPAGDRLAISGWGECISVIDVGTGRELFVTPGITRSGLAWDATGRRLAAVRAGEVDRRIGILSVGDGRECRFVPCPGSVVNPFFNLAVVAEGRAVVLQAGPDLAFMSPAEGRVLARVPFSHGPDGPGTMAVDGLGRLLTNGFPGCYRWPVGTVPDDPNRVRIGPPEPLPFHPGDRTIATSRDGRVLAQAMWTGYGMEPYAGGWVLNADVPKKFRRVAAGIRCGWTSVSPDGRFVAFDLHDRMVVVDSTTLAEVLAVPNLGVGGFTPDGKWLASNRNGAQLFAVGTWERGPRLGDGTVRAFSPDGRYAILTTTGGMFRYVEVATGRELVRFEDPDLKETAAAFGPDGATLYTTADGGFRVWDLRRIRERLAEIGLDWEATAFPPAAPASGPVRVNVIGTELLDPTKRAAVEQMGRTLRALLNPNP